MMRFVLLFCALLILNACSEKDMSIPPPPTPTEFNSTYTCWDGSIVSGNNCPDTPACPNENIKASYTLYFGKNEDEPLKKSLPQSLAESSCRFSAEKVLVVSAMTPQEKQADKNLSQRRAEYVKQELLKIGFLENQISVQDSKITQSDLKNLTEDELNQSVTISLFWP